MRGISRLLLFLALGAGVANAQPYTLVITGINDRAAFATTTSLIENFSTAQGYGFQHYAFQPGSQPADRGPELVSARVRAAAIGVKSGETFLVFINDHGDESVIPGDPLDAGIDLPGGQLYPHHRLQDDVATTLSPDSRFVLIGTHCFSGGGHHVTFARPNSCSAASTSHRSTAKTHDTLPTYEKRLSAMLAKPGIADIDRDGKQSLYEVHLLAVIGDVMNDGRGQVSSAAYADFFLGEGAYAKRAGAKLLPTSNFAEALASVGISSELGTGKVFEGMTRMVSIPGAEGCVLPRVRDASLDAFLRFASSASEALKAKLDFPEGYQPARMRPFIAYTQKLLKDAEDMYGPVLRERLREYANLRVEFEVAKTKGKLTPAEHANFTARFDKLENLARNQLAVFWNISETLEGFRRVERFYHLAPPEKRKRFDELLDCEMRPL